MPNIFAVESKLWTKMPYFITVSVALAVLTIGSAAAPQSQNAIIAQFFRYAEAIREVQLDNMLDITLEFVDQVVLSVPPNNRGPGTATLQSYLERGTVVRETGSLEQKFEHVYGLQAVFEGLKGQLDSESPESQVIAINLLGLLGVASDFAIEDGKFYNNFVEGATLMKAKLSPSTVEREQDLFSSIAEYTDSDFTQHEPLLQSVLSFKNRY
ncbi:uncharacterized protein LOC117587760 [Drosophila guanche]|uniref:Uncharacterized protein n=1 Tax=Drosophila guanche TaxID=7266 RepID=A0A3B0KHQ5_DROGU|nr:uncharacterized protein LOC117587760 [Drosophila guanche]SPP85929.1 Hypothetical predicted protein [Drosophila guanche]